MRALRKRYQKNLHVEYLHLEFLYFFLLENLGIKATKKATIFFFFLKKEDLEFVKIQPFSNYWRIWELLEKMPKKISKFNIGAILNFWEKKTSYKTNFFIFSGVCSSRICKNWSIWKFLKNMRAFRKRCQKRHHIEYRRHLEFLLKNRFYKSKVFRQSIAKKKFC
jgi:hypothetical protein